MPPSAASEGAESLRGWGFAECVFGTGRQTGRSFAGFESAPGSARGRSMTEETEGEVGAGSPPSWNGGSVAVVAEQPAQTGRASAAGGECAAGCLQVKEGQSGTGQLSLAPAWHEGSGLVLVKLPGDSLAGSHDPSGTPEQLAVQLALPGSAGPLAHPALLGSYLDLRPLLAWGFLEAPAGRPGM